MSSSSPTSRPSRRPSRDWLRIRRLPTRSLLFDLGLGVAITPYLFVTAARVNFPFEEPFWVYAVEGLAVALRRVWTIPAAALMLVAAGTAEVAHWPYPLGVAVLIYTVAANDYPRWFGWLYALVSAILLVLPTPYYVVERTPANLTQIIPEALVVTVVPTLLGLYARQRQDLIDSLRARHENASRQRALEAERIRAEERSRLANEIHDVVAHSVSLMIVHSGALKLAAADERTREIAEKIRNAGRMALEELRDLVGVLRHGDSVPLGPAPNLANLGGLIEESRTAGTQIEFHLKGTPRRVSGAVVLTTFGEEEYVYRALNSGAVGFLLKDSPPEDLVSAVRKAHEGLAVLDPAVTRTVIARFTDPATHVSPQARERIGVLTARELDVLGRLGEGLSNAEIGARLRLSETTVKSHVSRVMDKLGCANRTQAAILAYEAGLVSH